MGRMRIDQLALPVAGVVVLAGASATFWLPLLTENTSPFESTAYATSGPEQVANTTANATSDATPNTTQESSPRTPQDLIRFGSKTVKPRSEGSIRVASYNIENLFDDKDDPALSGSNDDKDETKPLSQLEGAAAAIKALDADVLALQEIESLEALTWFRDGWLKDLGYTYIASVDAGDARGIEQGVLSRFPIKNVENWPGAKLEGVHPEKAPDGEAGTQLVLHRSPLKVDVVLGDDAKTQTVTLFVVHHKSGFKSAYWREAEAVKVLELIKAQEKATPDRPIAVLGDFNSMPEQPSVQTYLTGGLIDTLADRKEGDPAWITHESGRVIDMILCNQVFAQHIVPGSAFVMGVPARLEGVDWRTTPPPVGYGSDHYPVVVDLKFDGVVPTSKRDVHIREGGS
jgi:endonuclease/exonuclease/phosphatase family metal-dependent hydrolase